MKKVTIFGSYNGVSIGDTAILLGILSSLERLYGQKIIVDVLVTQKINLSYELNNLDLKIHANEILISYHDKNSTLTEKIYSKIKRIFRAHSAYDMTKVSNALKSSDHLLIGGGNLIMDLYSEWPKILQNICNTAKATNTKYSFIGVGAAPISTNSGEYILKQCLINAYKVYFRDLQSKQFVQNKLNFNDGFLMPDCALGLNYKKNHPRSSKKVLFNIASVYGDSWPEKDLNKFDNYIDGMINLALHVYSQYKFEELVIFNSNYPTDKQGSKIFYERLKSSNLKFSVKLVKGRMHVAELIELGETASFTFVTRLHAGILTSLGGCKVIGIGYQPKVKDVLMEFSISNYTIDIETIIQGNGFEFIVEKALNDEHVFKNIHLENVDKSFTNILENN